MKSRRRPRCRSHAWIQTVAVMKTDDGDANRLSEILWCGCVCETATIAKRQISSGLTVFAEAQLSTTLDVDIGSASSPGCSFNSNRFNLRQALEIQFSAGFLLKWCCTLTVGLVINWPTKSQRQQYIRTLVTFVTVWCLNSIGLIRRTIQTHTDQKSNTRHWQKLAICLT